MTATLDSNPFVGLRPFESGESILFFGRQEQTMELLQRLHQHHFVAVTGSSGSGKSSLIRAGLIPRLQAGYLVNDNDRWTIAMMKPGETPLFNLAEALLVEPSLAANELTPATLEKKIKEEGADAVLDVLAPLWKAGSNLFLLVDQFEELFRFSLHGTDFEKKDEAKDFVNILLALAAQKDLPVYIVSTMRSDFIGDCALIYGLPEAMNQSQYIVPRLTRPQLRNAIEGPVRLYKGKINPALTSRLLNDVQLINDELPLLQHALMRIWDFEEAEDKNGELDLEDYAAIGGIKNALSNDAEKALQEMAPEEQSIAKKMFQALTAIDENGRKIRRPARLSELVALTGAGKEQVLRIIKQFISDKRFFLIVSSVENGKDAVVDISHESLIRQWGTLGQWVAEEAESRETFLQLSKTTKRLTEAAKDFEDGRHGLLQGLDLELALRWRRSFKPDEVWAQRYVENSDDAYEKTISFLEKSKHYQQFLQKEKEARQRQKRRNRWLLVAGLIVVIVGVSILAYTIYRNNLENKKQLALNYWSSSQAIREKGDYLGSLHFTAEAVELNKDKDLSKNLLTDTEPFLPPAGLDTILSFPDVILCTAYSPDNKRIAVGSNDGSVRIVDEETKKPIGKAMMHEGPVNSVVFSPDGKWLLTASNDGRAHLWEVATGRAMLVLENSTHVFDVAFNPKNGKQLLTASVDGYVRLWDTTGRQLDSFGHSKIITAASFSHDGKWILSILDSTAQLWEVATKRQIPVPAKNGSPIITAAFDKKGTRFLTAGPDSTIRIWEVAEIPQLLVAIPIASVVSSAAFSPDGQWVLTGERDGYARFWSVAVGKQIGSAQKHTGPVYDVAFRPDGKKFLTTGWDKAVRVWSTAAFTATENDLFSEHPGLARTTAFNRDGTKIVTAAVDDTARIWDVVNKKLLLVLPHGDKVSNAEFSRDGSLVLTTCHDGTIRLWNGTTGAQKDSFVLKSYGADAVFSPDGKRVLTSDGDGNIFVLNAEPLQSVDSFRYTAYVESIVQSPDGETFLVASDSSAQLLDARSKKQIAIFKHLDRVIAAAFSPDGTSIVTGSYDFTVRLWNSTTKRQIGPAMKHERAVKTAAFSPDGKWIVTTSWDSKIRIWDALTLKQIGAPITRSGGFNTAVFSPDGKKILMAGGDGSIYLQEIGGDLDIPPDLFKLQAQALSGTRLNTVTGETECLSVEEWNPLKKSYREKGREHYRDCKYPSFNLWRRFYAAEAKTVRPGE